LLLYEMRYGAGKIDVLVSNRSLLIFRYDFRTRWERGCRNLYLVYLPAALTRANQSKLLCRFSIGDRAQSPYLSIKALGGIRDYLNGH